MPDARCPLADILLSVELPHSICDHRIGWARSFDTHTQFLIYLECRMGFFMPIHHKSFGVFHFEMVCNDRTECTHENSGKNCFLSRDQVNHRSRFNKIWYCPHLWYNDTMRWLDLQVDEQGSLC
jgi:hypothetical protein